MKSPALPTRGALLLLLAALVSPAHAAEVAFLYSTYQDKQFAYMPGEYLGQYNSAGAILKDAGFPWDRVDSAAVEGGALLQRGYKVLVISYTSVMSPAEAAAVAAFAAKGGRLFVVYSSLGTPWTADGPGQPGKGMLAQTMGMETAPTAAGARCMKADIADHPLLALLPPYVFNAHGHAVRVKPLPGTQVVASWASDEQAAADPASGALLVSPTTVCFTGFLWRLPEARLIVANALNFLLGRPAATATVVWAPVKQAPAVANGLNLAYASEARQDVDAIGWEISQLRDGLTAPTCAVVYPVTAPDVYQHARRLARALSCPLVSDRAAIRDALDRQYDLLAVGRVLPDRCENPLGNTLLGVREVLKQYAGQPDRAVIRVAPAEARRGSKRLLLVGGTDLGGLTRAEELVRAAVRFDPGPAAGKIALWRLASTFGDLVYPWTSRAPGLLTELALPAAVNQVARTRFVVTAAMGLAPVEVSLQLSPLSGPAGVFPADRVKLLLTRTVRSNITKIEEPHPLVPGTHFSLEPAAHQEVWLLADCTGAAPGVYTGTLALQSGSGPLGSLKVTLDVAPITLAATNRHQKLTCVWDYAISGHLHGNLLSLPPGQQLTPERQAQARWGEHYEQHFCDHWRAYVDDLEAHGVNVMFIASTMGLPQYQVNGQQIDTARLGPLVSYARQHGFRLFIFTQILGQGCYYPDSDVIAGAGNPIGSPGWDAAYCQVLRAYGEFMRGQGLTNKQWAVYPFDEPHCAHDRDLINHVAALIARTDPQIQIWADPVRPADVGGADKDQNAVDFWKSMEKSVAIWWPADGYLPVGSASLKYLQTSGKPFGFYRCAAYSTKNREAVRPDRYYRAFGWQVEERGASGMGFWTWLAWLGDSWNDEDAQTRDGDGAVVYEGPAGPITTNDWEAWGEGVDDYKHLEALDAAVAQRAQRVGQNDALCGEARRLRAEAVATVCKDIRQADAQRARVREMILKLRP
jgi:hypothetical protein